MATETRTRRSHPTIGRGATVVGFLLVQGLALAGASLADRPTWYAYFIVVSVIGTAFYYESERSPLGALPVFLAGQGVAAAATVLLCVAVGTLSHLLDVAVGLGIPTGGVPWLYLGYAVLGTAAAVVTTDEGGFTVATAGVGALLTVALGLPLFLFVARQSPDLIVDKATDPDVHRVLYLGVYGPLLAAVLSLLLGVPLAHLLAKGFTGQQFVESLVDLPLVVPHSVAGIIILFGFGEGGAFPALSVLGSMTGLILAMTFVSAPYAVNTARESFEAIDDRLEYASRIHGASRWQTFRRVTAPLATRGMITGGILAWARAVSEFGAVAVVAYSVSFFYPLAGEHVTAQHAPVFVYNTYLQGGLDESGAVAFLLLAVSALIFLVVRYLTDRDGVLGEVPP
ncbi:MAG: ABC transporter permease [Haloarculaceae archaeon]